MAEPPEASKVAELKAQLKDVLYGTERGLQASNESRAKVLELNIANLVRSTRKSEEAVLAASPGSASDWTKSEALVGFEKSVKHLDNHAVEIGTKVITKPKEVRKFEGEGMPLYHSSEKGDLYVTFDVVFPKDLTEDQKAKLMNIFT